MRSPQRWPARPTHQGRHLRLLSQPAFRYGDHTAMVLIRTNVSEASTQSPPAGFLARGSCCPDSGDDAGAASSRRHGDGGDAKFRRHREHVPGARQHGPRRSRQSSGASNAGLRDLPSGPRTRRFCSANCASRSCSPRRFPNRALCAGSRFRPATQCARQRPTPRTTRLSLIPKTL